MELKVWTQQAKGKNEKNDAIFGKRDVYKRQACYVHGQDADVLVKKLNAAIAEKA